MDTVVKKCSLFFAISRIMIFCAFLSTMSGIKIVFKKNPLAFKKQRIKSVIKFSFHHFRNGANQERRNFELKPQQRQNPVKAVKSLLMPLVNYSF